VCDTSPEPVTEGRGGGFCLERIRLWCAMGSPSHSGPPNLSMTQKAITMVPGPGLEWARAVGVASAFPCQPDPLAKSASGILLNGQLHQAYVIEQGSSMELGPAWHTLAAQTQVYVGTATKGPTKTKQL
jgi:hypothetical protein